MSASWRTVIRSAFGRVGIHVSMESSRASLPSATSCSTTVTVNALAMLRVGQLIATSIGAPVDSSATPQVTVATPAGVTTRTRAPGTEYCVVIVDSSPAMASVVAPSRVLSTVLPAGQPPAAGINVGFAVSEASVDGESVMLVAVVVLAAGTAPDVVDAPVVVVDVPPPLPHPASR